MTDIEALKKLPPPNGIHWYRSGFAPRKRDGRPALVEGQLMPYGTGYQLVATAVEFK